MYIIINMKALTATEAKSRFEKDDGKITEKEF